MRILYLIVFLMGFKTGYAHTPDLSSLMIYELNGKPLLVLKSALTAFEGAINIVYGKDAFKTPEEFIQLVQQHFQKNCEVIVNGNTAKFSNIQVQLGHETTLFAELDSITKPVKSLFVKNTAFKDLYNNQCEVILTLNGLPQKQYILDKANGQQVKWMVNNNKWETGKAGKIFFNTPVFVLLAGLAIGLVIFYVFRKKTLQIAF